MQVGSNTNSPAKNAWLTWLIFGVLGVMAAIGGLVLPQGLRNLHEAVAAIPASEPAPEGKDPMQYDPPALPELPLAGPMLVRLALGTIFVLILCILTLWAGKRWVRPLAAPVGEARKLRLLEALPLAGRCTVFLIQAEETKVLVGMDQAGIKALLPLAQSFDSALKELAREED